MRIQGSKGFHSLLFWLPALMLGSCKVFALDNSTFQMRGLSSDQQTKVLDAFPSLRTAEPRLADLNLALKLVFAEFQMDIAELRHESGTWTLEALSLPRIRELQFQGLSEVSERDLLKESPFVREETFREEYLPEFTRRIEKILENRGYFSATVQTFASLHREDTHQWVDLRFVIHMGPRTNISRVILESPHPEIAQIFSGWARQFRGSPYRDTTWAEIQTSLKNELARQRLFRAEIQEPRLEVDEKSHRVEIRIPLKQDEQYFIEMPSLQRFSRAEIEEAIDLTNFSSVNSSIGPELSLRIKNHLQSQGHARAEVYFEEGPGNQKWQKRLVLDIREGPRIRVKDLQFVGGNSTSNEDLVRNLQKLSARNLARGIFVRSELDQALENLKIQRQNSGYLKAKLISTRVSYSREKDSVNIVINFNEGPQTLIEDIRFEGNNSVSESTLKGLLQLKTGTPLLLDELDRSSNILRKYYADLGHLDFRILNDKENLIAFNEDNSAASLVFRLHEGPQVRVGSIQIEGTTLTQRPVLLKEIEFSLGDLLTPQKIEESSSRLQRLGHFSSVEIRTLEENSNVASRTVVIRVQERDPGLFNLGIGASSERDLTIRGYTGIAYRNIRGSGRAASLRMEGKYNVTQIQALEGSISLGYLEPYLLDTRTRSRTNFTQSIFVTNYDRLLATETRAFVLSLEQDFNTHIQMGWDLINFARYKDFSLRSEADFATVLTDISSTGPTLTWDYRDHPFNPTQGSFSQLGLEYAHPAIGSTFDIEYFKLTMGTTWYRSTSPRVVWANSLRGGILQNRSPSGSVPYDKAGFQIGGLKSVRGFQPGEAYPNRRELGSDNYRMSTESQYGLFKSELRLPLWGNLGAALFYDAGYVSIRSLSFPVYYRDSVGLGLRYHTPVGPLTIDYGWKLNRLQSRDENDGVLHISIGSF